MNFKEMLDKLKCKTRREIASEKARALLDADGLTNLQISMLVDERLEARGFDCGDFTCGDCPEKYLCFQIGVQT